MRRAGRDLLSLALMDARNHTLHLLSTSSSPAPGRTHAVERRCPAGRMPDPLWLAGHVGWMAEAWLGRNTQRALGNACPHAADAARLHRAARRPTGGTPSRCRWRKSSARTAGPVDLTKSYLLETLESTLELLENDARDQDEALYFYRLALFHEDLRGEQF
jgi:iron(II)-dependent oxidoreductase